MVIPPLVLLLMPVGVASNLVLRLRAQSDVVPAAPVDGGALSRPQLTVGIDKEALERD